MPKWRCLVFSLLSSLLQLVLSLAAWRLNPQQECVRCSSRHHWLRCSNLAIWARSRRRVRAGTGEDLLRDLPARTFIILRFYTTEVREDTCVERIKHLRWQKNVLYAYTTQLGGWNIGGGFSNYIRNIVRAHTHQRVLPTVKLWNSFVTYRRIYFHLPIGIYKFHVTHSCCIIRPLGRFAKSSISSLQIGRWKQKMLIDAEPDTEEPFHLDPALAK